MTIIWNWRVCTCETLLSFSFESDDKDLVTEGYNLIQSNHPSNTKRGSVCIYYKECLTVHIVKIIFSLMPSCEVTIKKKGYLFYLVDLLSTIFRLKSKFTIILGDLNARSPAW